MAYREKSIEAENEMLKAQVAELQATIAKSVLKAEKPKKESVPWTKEQREQAKFAVTAMVVITGIISMFVLIFLPKTSASENVSILVGFGLLFLVCLWTTIRLATGHWLFWQGVFGQQAE